MYESTRTNTPNSASVFALFYRCTCFLLVSRIFLFVVRRKGVRWRSQCALPYFFKKRIPTNMNTTAPNKATESCTPLYFLPMVRFTESWLLTSFSSYWWYLKINRLARKIITLNNTRIEVARANRLRCCHIHLNLNITRVLLYCRVCIWHSLYSLPRNWVPAFPAAEK